MFQTKYKYFNKKIKICFLLLILMWSLMGQLHIYGKSSTYDTGIVMAAAAEYIGYDTNNMRKTLQENISEITTTNDTKKISLTKSATTENKVMANNATTSTIYGHINENDNNSNKLPQNVAKRDQQQPNMMYRNIKMPAPSQSQSESTSSSSTLTLYEGAQMETLTTAEASLPPTESFLMPKDQLNKTERHEKEKNNDNKWEDNKERKILEVHLKDKRASKAAEKSSDNSNIDNVFKNIINYDTTEPNLNETSTVNKIQKVKDAIRISKKTSLKFKKFESTAHAHQQLISKFALRFKQISRVTFFTCTESSIANENINNSKYHLNMKVNILEFVKRMYTDEANNASSIMMKVVLIDHLVNNKNRAETSSTKSLMEFCRPGSCVTASASATQNTLNNVSWLEQILRPEPLRQIVVVNLSCGVPSRRLLEMASNKAFFNSMYHWLLLKDYLVFNRHTEIDDADDIESKMKSYSYSKEAEKSLKEEIVNDTNATNLQVKRVSVYPEDIVGASTSGLNPDEQNNNTPTNLTSTSYSTFKQQQLVGDKSSTTFNTSRAGITVENDREIIEKFLEKLNINVNTELTLAKRGMRVIKTPSYSSTETFLNMMQKPPNSTSTDSNDYNTVQKMDYYLLYDVWNPGKQYGGVLNVSEIGSFTPTEGLKLRKWYSTTSTTRRRLDMQLARLRCLIVVTHKNSSDTLEEYLTSHYDTHLDSMNRFNYALLTYVKDIFNFSFILSKTSSWGYLKNGKFDGMIGALVRKEADIGGSPIFLRIERVKVIDYTTRTWVARPCFIFRHPPSTIKDRIIFLQPFSNKVWIFLFVSGCITIVLLWLLTSVERKLNSHDVGLEKGTISSSCDLNTLQEVISTKKQHNFKDNGKPHVNPAGLNKRFELLLNILKINNSMRPVLFFSESFLFYIGSICQQGLTFSTFFFSGRCIVFTSLLFSFAIYQFYSASIVGTLLMEKPKTICTLRDLLHSSLEIGIEDIVYNRDYFLRTKDPDAQELYAKKVTSMPISGKSGFGDPPPNGFALPENMTKLPDGQKTKPYPGNLHSHITIAHAKTNEASNWYEPDYGVVKVKKGGFAFHVDVATAYKIIADTFSEKEICELAEIQLFPPQKMVSIVQKGSPLKKIITYGLRRVTEVGLSDYQRKVWHSPKPRCIKQLHTDDLKVDMQTFTSALLVLIFGYAVSLLILSLEIVHFKLWQGYTMSRT